MAGESQPLNIVLSLVCANLTFFFFKDKVCVLALAVLELTI